MITKNHNRSRLFIFLLSLGICIFCFQFVYDFGYTTDELVQKYHGYVTADYVNSLTNGKIFDKTFTKIDLKTYNGRHYGTWFQLTNVLVENKILDDPDIITIYYLRHKTLLVYFALALFCWGMLLYRRFDQLWLALAGVVLLATTPRVLGHQFFNVKDGVLLCAYVIACFSGTRMVSESKVGIMSAVLHGLLTGMAIGVRILGVYLIPLTLLIFLLKAVFEKGKGIKRTIISVTVYLGASAIFTIVFWPTLWENPVTSFLEAFETMSKFAWSGEVHLDGKIYDGHDLPWFYVPRWIMISTPLLTLVVIVIGILQFSYTGIVQLQSRKLAQKFWADLFMMGAFLGPIAIVVLLESTLYNAWRQMLFVFPPLLYFSVIFVSSLQGRWSSHPLLGKNLGPILISAMILLQSIEIVRMHPFQNVYFNALAKKPWLLYYDMDYWNHGYRHVYKRLAERTEQNQKTIVRAMMFERGPKNYQLLPKKYKDKLEYCHIRSTESVVVSMFRLQKHKKLYLPLESRDDIPKYHIRRKGQVIYGVYDCRSVACDFILEKDD